MRLSTVVLLGSALAGCATSPSAPSAPAEKAPLAAAAPVAPPAFEAPDAVRVLTLSPAALGEACAAALKQGEAEIARFKALPAPRETTAALTVFDDGIRILSDMYARAAVISNSHPDAATREAGQACEQTLDKAMTAINLDRGIYDVLAGLSLEGQDGDTQRWVQKTLRDFRRAGVDRDEATREKVQALQEELVKIGQRFGQAIREDVRTVELTPAQLTGLPEDFKRAHPVGKDGKVRLTTDYPDYVPFMAYAKDGKAREALWRAFRLRGHPQNLETLKALVTKRHELATLLGYPNWAAYVTEDKMIRSEKAAGDFIEKIAHASEARAKSDYQTLLARKKKDDKKATVVLPWDQGYLEDRVKAEQYSFDSQEVRPYLEYTRVKEGVLGITAQLFGLTYKKLEGAPVWHPDIEAYDVFEGEKHLGRFYLDMHPREGKYKHAAQWDLTTGQAGRRLPETVLMCNFPKPGAEPALMQHSEVETFFHEFGHLLHHILGGHTKWAGVSGVRTERDFVEAPSQMLEEWAWAPESLQTFARHYQTNQPIPVELVARMKKADEFGKGLGVRQQMFYAATSLNLYARNPEGLDTTALVKEMQEKYTPFAYVPGTYFQLSFGHLDGYSAVYYTYMWSLVIAKDLFTRFDSAGLMNADVARAYRASVLEPGGSKDAALLVKDFLGRDFGFDAYEHWLNGN